jgi:hypothetical protein
MFQDIQFVINFKQMDILPDARCTVLHKMSVLYLVSSDTIKVCKR